jgi:hypothetical protein
MLRNKRDLCVRKYIEGGDYLLALKLSQGYSDSLKHIHRLIYSNCYERCAFALKMS